MAGGVVGGVGLGTWEQGAISTGKWFLQLRISQSGCLDHHHQNQLGSY